MGERNKHMQQRKDDNELFKRDKLEMAKAAKKAKATNERRVAAAKAANSSELKASKRVFTVKRKDGKGDQEENVEPEAKKVKPDEHENTEAEAAPKEEAPKEEEPNAA